MAMNRFTLQAASAALLVGVASPVPAQSLDIKPGLWKKSMKMETGGKTVMNSTVDACMGAEDIDLKKTAAKLASSPSCKVVKQELSPKAVKVALQCKDMSVESVTQVRSQEHVVVSATMKPATGGDVTLSSEEWRFVKPDCAAKSR